MKRHQRTLLAIATVSAAAAALAGCSGGSNSESGEEPQTLTFAYGPADDNDLAQWEALIDAFEEDHPGVTIESERLPGESWAQVIQTRVQGAARPTCSK